MNATKTCQWRDGCAREPILRERFCRAHRRAMLREMEDSGYLEPLPAPSPSRGDSAREDLAQTKYGADE